MPAKRIWIVFPFSAASFWKIFFLVRRYWFRIIFVGAGK
jgi:hypothetical protein